MVIQLLTTRANPWKRCAALGLQPGQHAILQVPALSVGQMRMKKHLLHALQ